MNQRYPSVNKWQKNIVIYLYILIIFLSTLTFYSILQIESEKQMNTKYKMRKISRKINQQHFIPNVPSGIEKNEICSHCFFNLKEIF